MSNGTREVQIREPAEGVAEEEEEEDMGEVGGRDGGRGRSC